MTSGNYVIVGFIGAVLVAGAIGDALLARWRAERRARPDRLADRAS